MNETTLTTQQTRRVFASLHPARWPIRPTPIARNPSSYSSARSARAGATQARIRFANDLYRQLVQLCAAGEAYWRLTDAAKAVDYVVNPGASVAAPLPPVAG